MPFGSLPACAADCGILYDANGGCVPPAVDTVDNSCFCSFNRLSPWFQGPSEQLCPEAGCGEADYASIQSWYTSYCNSATAGGGGGNNEGEDQQTTTTSTDASGATGAGSSSQNQGPGGDWSVFLVLLNTLPEPCS